MENILQILKTKCDILSRYEVVLWIKMIFVNSAEMKIELTPEQSEMLSTKENIKLIIRDNPDTVMAFDIMDEHDLIGFVLVHRFEDRKYFLWEYAIDIGCQNQHKGTKALTEFIQPASKKTPTSAIRRLQVVRWIAECAGFLL